MIYVWEEGGRLIIYLSESEETIATNKEGENPLIIRDPYTQAMVKVMVESNATPLTKETGEAHILKIISDIKRPQ